MRHAVSNEIYTYWRGLKKDGCPPERSAVEPGAIRGVLADTFVLDFDPTRGFPLRICGSKINAVFLKELRGTPFLQIWRQADRFWIESILEATADEEAPYVLLADAGPAGLAPVEIEVTLLPLRHQGATHARMLGSLSAGAGSDWLGLIGSRPAALKAYRVLESDTPEPRPATLGFLGRTRAAWREGSGV
jgi:hypothetical protein